MTTNATSKAAADTATEFNSAKDGVLKASRSIKEARPIKEARRATRGVAKADQRLTRLESTAARLTRELKALGDRYNAATEPELKEYLAGQIVDINAKIIAFNTDLNTQLAQLRTDVGQNTDDIAVEKGRNDGQDIEIDMLTKGQQSLNQRVSSISTMESARTPWWQIVVAIIAGVIGAIMWNNHLFGDSFTLPDGQVANVPYGPANSGWTALIAGILVAAAISFILSFFTSGKKTEQANTTTIRQSETTTTPVVLRPVPVRTSYRKTVPPTEPIADPAPTQVIVTEPGVPTGARS